MDLTRTKCDTGNVRAYTRPHSYGQEARNVR